MELEPVWASARDPWQAQERVRVWAQAPVKTSAVAREPVVQDLARDLHYRDPASAGESAR